MTLWSASEAAAATGGMAVSGWSGVGGVSIDTRELARGDLFVALAGENRDGHDFVAAALAAGAGAAMVSHRPGDVAEDAPLLLVDDTLAALERLGAAARARTGARVIAVTGSVGKTSTKEMLRAMLTGQGRVHAAVRSFNNHWGVPLTLARMPEETGFAVLEIGMNHAGEITPLSRLARPDVALITNVEAVHLAAFDSVEQIADAKAEIFAGLPEDGIAVLNADNAHFERLSAAARPRRIVAFGGGSDRFRLIEARDADGGTEVRALVDGAEMTFTIGAPGRHFVQNALGALAAVACAGGDVAKAAAALAGWTPPGGRGSKARIDLPGGALTLLDESYNANPVSMRAALAVLGATRTDGRRIAILGDMLELGPEEVAIHRDLATARELEGIDRVHSCGPLMRAFHEALPDAIRGTWEADSGKLAARLDGMVDAGDVCMVKGSLGARMARVVAALKALGEGRADNPDGDR